MNVEDGLWSDQRFLRFCIKIGDEARAVGYVVLAWKLAQKHWCPDRKPIPEKDWFEAGLPEDLIETGLAERKEDGRIYVRGSESQFAWWFQRQEAGKKGGEASAAKRSPGGRRAVAKRSGSKSKQIQPSSSSSFSFSSSSSSSDSSSISENYSVGEASGELPVEVYNPIGYFIGVYRKAYQARYGAEAKPDVTGKIQGQIKRLLEDVPLARACALVQTYCAMSDQWFVTKAHDFGTFLANLSKVGLALDTGKTITRTEARQAETSSYHQDQLRRIAEGSL